MNDRIATNQFNECGWHVVSRDVAERTAVIQEQVAKFGLTDPCRIFKYRLKHRSKFARRTTDDLQNLGRRRLLLQRFGQFARARLHFVEQPCILDCDHCLVGERLASSICLSVNGCTRRRKSAITPIGVPSRSIGTQSPV